MISDILRILGAGFSLWDSKEKRKYVDKLMALKKEYYIEINKPDDKRSDAILDNISFELRVLGIAFSTQVGTPDTEIV